jgi:flagellar hook-basal body complex protein FliE
MPVEPNVSSGGSVPQEYDVTQGQGAPVQVGKELTTALLQLLAGGADQAAHVHGVRTAIESADEQLFNLTDAGKSLKNALSKIASPQLTKADTVQAEAVVIAAMSGEIGPNSIPKSISDSGKAITAVSAMQRQTLSDSFSAVDSGAAEILNNLEGIQQKVGIGSPTMNNLLALAQNKGSTPDKLHAAIQEAAKGMDGSGEGKYNPFLNGCAVVSLTLVMMEMVKDQQAREKLDSILFLQFQAMDKAITKEMIHIVEQKASTEFLQNIMGAVAIGMGSAVSIGLLGKATKQLDAGDVSRSQITQAYAGPTSQLFSGMLVHMIDGGMALIKGQLDAAKLGYDFVQKAAQDAESQVSRDEQAATEIINQLVQALSEMMKKMQVVNTLTAQGG